MPNVPSFMRRRAPRTLRSMCDSRSRLRIASSRSAACCTSSSASAFFSITIPSRFRTTSDNSASLSSRIFLVLVQFCFCHFRYSQVFCSFFSSCTLRFDASRPEKFQYLSYSRSEILTTHPVTLRPISEMPCPCEGGNPSLYHRSTTLAIAFSYQFLHPDVPCPTRFRLTADLRQLHVACRPAQSRLHQPPPDCRKPFAEPVQRGSESGNPE